MISIVEQDGLLRYVQIEGVELLGLGSGADYLYEVGIDALHPKLFQLLRQRVTHRLKQTSPVQHACWGLLEDDEEVDVGAGGSLAAGYGAVEGDGDEIVSEGFLGGRSVAVGEGEQEGV